MSKLQELIKELCPDGVEFRKLGEVCEITIGEFVHKNKQIEDGKYPVYNGGRENTGFYESYNNIGNKVIISARGANAGYVNKVLTNYWAGNSCYSLFPLDVQYLNWFFLYYVLKSKEKELMGNQQTGSIPALSKKQIEQIEIPLPPLEVQNEIVRILDTFTSHAAELQARKEQYEYYRNKLLTFDENDEGVKWMKLGDVTFYPKERISISLLHKDNYIGVDNLLPNKQGKKESDYVPSNGSCILYNVNDILIGNIRPYLKKIWMSNNNGGTNGDVLVFRLKDEFLNHIMHKYLYYLLSSDDFFNYDNQYAKGAKMPRGDKNMNMKYIIPIPPFSEQQRIVSILDKFESLVNDLTAGLPAEIAAVQEQYEYYRNKLLTFKRKS